MTIWRFVTGLGMGGITPLATTFVSSTRLRATGNARSVRSNVPVVVNTPDSETSNTVTVNVTRTGR